MIEQSTIQLNEWLGHETSRLTHQLNYLMGEPVLDSYLHKKGKRDNSVSLFARTNGLEILISCGVFKHFRFGLEYSQISSVTISGPNDKYPNVLIFELWNVKESKLTAIFFKCKNTQAISSFLRNLPMPWL